MQQGLFTAKPWHGHDVFTLWVHPPMSTCPTLTTHITTNLSPKDIAGYGIMKLKVSQMHLRHWLVKAKWSAE